MLNTRGLMQLTVNVSANLQTKTTTLLLSAVVFKCQGTSYNQKLYLYYSFEDTKIQLVKSCLMPHMNTEVS